nr:uncharacterized protein LOC104103312 [Nicotiana tomentosiformis]
MAPLRKNTIQHFTHPEHSLTEYDSNTGYLCDGCKIPGIGKRYRCHGCEFDLHEYCGTCPTILSSFMHPYHSLKLVVRKPQGNRQFDRICNVCCDSVEGLFYRCEICEFDVHPLCTQLPETLRHVLHQIACTVGDKKSHIDGLKELFEDLGVVWLPVDKDNNSGIEIDVAGKSGRNKKSYFTNKGQEVPPEVMSNEGLTSQEPSATEASEDEVEVLPEDVSLGKE